MVSDRTHELFSITFPLLIGNDASDIEEGKGFLVADHWSNRLEKARSKELLGFCLGQEKIEPVIDLRLGWQSNPKLSLRSLVKLGVIVIVQFVSHACEKCIHNGKCI